MKVLGLNEDRKYIESLSWLTILSRKLLARDACLTSICLMYVSASIQKSNVRISQKFFFFFFFFFFLFEREREGRYARTKFFPDRKLLHYGSLPRRPRQLEGREMAHNVVEDSDYPRASPNVRITSFVCLRFEERISSQGDE